MSESCKDCVLEKRVESLEAAERDNIKRITALELQGVRTEERVVTIFKMFSEIKDTLATLISDVAYIKNKPGKTYEKLQYELIKWAVLFLAGYFGAKFIK